MKKLLFLLGLLGFSIPTLAQSSILGVGMYGTTPMALSSGASGGAQSNAPPSYLLNGYNATGLNPSTATYISGLATTGAKGATCTLTFTGGATQAIGTVTLTSINAVATGAVVSFSTVGTGYVSAPTAAAASNGTAACSGALVVSSSLGAYTPFATDANGNLQSNATSIQGYPVAVTAPTAGQALVYSGTAWKPSTAGSGASLPYPGIVYATSATGGNVVTQQELATSMIDSSTTSMYLTNANPTSPGVNNFVAGVGAADYEPWPIDCSLQTRHHQCSHRHD